jgi:hypothetical protein
MSSPKRHHSMPRKKLIAQLVNFLSTSESMQLKPYSLGEACLKASFLVDELFKFAILP